MSEIGEFAKCVGDRLVDTNNPASATNKTTVAGGAVGTIASILIMSPEPNTHLLGLLLLGISGIITLIKEEKKS